MLSISSGHSADYLLDAVATGRESYYTDFVSADGEGEPPGRWYGAGAELLGLVGEVNADVMRAVYGEFRDPRDPDGNRRLGNPPRNYPNGEALRDKLLAKEPDATPERQEEIATEAERMVRNNIGFYDATFSPPKSVTVVHAAYESQEVKARAAGDDATADEWAAKRELVEEAIWEGNRAQLDYLAEHAGYTRVGHHGGGAGRWVDAHAWTVASFFQHDSRNHDPQLHIHNAVLNRVEGPDGKWRTLSGQDLNLAKRGAGAVGDRAMFEHLASKSGLPSAMRADGRCRELTGVDQKVMGHFSSRSQALTPKAAELAKEYERAYGHAPNTVQMHRFNQRATLATRPAKEHTAESSADRLARWDRELRTEIGSELAAVAENVSKQQPPEPRSFDVTATLETAVAAAQASDSRFTLSTALAEIDATLPDYLGGLSGAESHAMLRAMAELAVESDPVLSLRAEGPGEASLPAEFRLANGRSAFTQPESELFATKEHVRSERALQAAAVERGAAAMSPELAEFFTTELAELGIELGVDQRAAVHGVLTDGAKLSALVGPAGCIAGETELWDPVAMRGRRVDELCAAKVRPWVQTLSGPVRAEVPYLKGFATLYRVELADGRSCLATADHLFLTRFGWRRVSDMSVGLDILGGSVPDTAHPSESLAGAHRCSETHASFPAGCHRSCRLCDPPLPLGSVADLGFVPSQSDVLGRSRYCSLQDGPAAIASRNLVYQLCDRRATTSSRDLRYDGPWDARQGVVPSSLASGCCVASGTHVPDASSYRPHHRWNQESLRPQPSPLLCRDASRKHLLDHDVSTSNDLPCSHYRSQWVPITNVQYERTDNYYDLHVPCAEHYLAEGIWHHNSGKSFTVGALARAWQDPSLWNGEQHRAFGLASSQVATEVLAGDGLETRNVARWLATQERLATGGTREDDVAWQLAEGDLVLIDESAMANTSDITRIREHVETAGGKLLLTGDHRQLAAVGAGGGMGLVAGTGMSYELTEARRFNAEWEAAASLRLREGDDTALGEYRKHGRILDAGTAEQSAAKATRAYVADTLDGKRTLLIADTNEAAAGLSAAVRADLIRLGRVEEDGVPVGKLGAVAGVGDVVQARRNAWDLAGHEGNRRGPINREQYKVTAVRDDGSLVVDHMGERMVLPPSYAKDIELGYASTVHSAQGLTVDTSHTVASARTGPQAFYVGMTRGQDSNTAYVETISVPPDSPPGAVHDAVHRDPVAVLAGSLELAQPDRAAVEEMEASAAEMGSVVTAGERFACVSEMAVAGRTAALLDRLTDKGKLTDLERRRLAADQGTPMLSTLLRQVEVAGHDPEHVLTEAVTANSLDSARSIASVLHDRVTRAVPTLEPRGDSHANWVPKVADPAMTAHLRDLAKAADDRRDVLGEQAVVEGPQWAVEVLGAVPDEEAARAQWTRAAGVVAAHRERTGHDAEGEALPSPPSPGRVEEYASWWAGWRALGRPDTDVEERELSDGQLRMRVRAMEREAAWQPRYVARELSGTTQAAEQERQTAVIRGAEAGAATDAGERARLEAEAAEAQARAGQLAEQAKRLAEADTVRAQWYAHTANTRAADQRARLELSRRGVDVDDPAGRVTARELLEAQSLGVEVDDLRREVTAEHDLAEVAAGRDEDARVFDDRVSDRAETALVDVRESSHGSAVAQDRLGDWTRVPDIGEVAEDVDISTSARAEVDQRATLDQRADEDERDRDDGQWRTDVVDEPVAEQDLADVNQ